MEALTDAQIEKFLSEFKQEDTPLFSAISQKIFSKTLDEVESQYLAHVIRVLEKRAQEATKYPAFSIILNPRKTVSYAKARVNRPFSGVCRYCIEYGKGLTPMKARICIAHELGHLFFEIIENENGKKSGIYGEDRAEDFAWFFAAHVMHVKNKFYQKDNSKLVIPNDWNGVVDCIQDLCKEMK